MSETHGELLLVWEMVENPQQSSQQGWGNAGEWGALQTKGRPSKERECPRTSDRQIGGLPSAGFPYMDVIVDTEKSNFGGRVGRKHPAEVSSRKSEERELTSKQKSHKAAFYTGHCLKFLLWLSSCSLVVQSWNCDYNRKLQSITEKDSAQRHLQCHFRF